MSYSASDFMDDVTGALVQCGALADGEADGPEAAGAAAVEAINRMAAALREIDLRCAPLIDDPGADFDPYDEIAALAETARGAFAERSPNPREDLREVASDPESRAHVVAIGNPFDGLALVGPFESGDAAAEWAEANHDAPDWWVLDLTAPERST